MCAAKMFVLLVTLIALVQVINGHWIGGWGSPPLVVGGLGGYGGYGGYGGGFGGYRYGYGGGLYRPYRRLPPPAFYG